MLHSTSNKLGYVVAGVDGGGYQDSGVCGSVFFSLNYVYNEKTQRYFKDTWRFQRASLRPCKPNLLNPNQIISLEYKLTEPMIVKL